MKIKKQKGNKTKNWMRGYVYNGKGLVDQIENASERDYEIFLENAQVSVQFTEVHDYSTFTPYEFGTKPLKVIIVDGAREVKIAEYLTSPSAGTVLYFNECVKDLIHPNKFYTVKLYLSYLFIRELEQYALQLFQNTHVHITNKK